MVRFLILLISTIFLISCGTTYPPQPSYKKKLKGKYILYAKYEILKNNRMKISEIRFKPPSSKYLPYIRLNDLSPAFDINRASCISGEVGSLKHVKIQCKEIPILFRKKKVNKGVTGFINVITLGGLAGPKGKPFGIGRYSYDIFFDKVAFERAVNTLDFDVIDKIIKINDTKLSKYYAIGSYKDPYAYLSSLGITLIVNDKSGLYDLLKPKIVLSTIRYSKFDSCEINLDPVSEFNKCLNKNIIRALYKSLKVSDNFNFKKEYDEVSNRIYLTILSKDFYKLLPNFQVLDRNIEGYFDGDELVLKNKTFHFIHIDNIAVYYNKYIFNMKVDTDIPPKAEKGIEINISSLNKVSSYNAMTKKMLKNRKINFGFAIKYRMIDINKEITYFKTRTFNLFSVVLGRASRR